MGDLLFAACESDAGGTGKVNKWKSEPLSFFEDLEAELDASDATEP